MMSDAATSERRDDRTVGRLAVRGQRSRAPHWVAMRDVVVPT
jgi:hypothetical protein